MALFRRFFSMFSGPRLSSSAFQRSAIAPEDRHPRCNWSHLHNGINRHCVILTAAHPKHENEGERTRKERADRPRERESSPFKYVASRDDLARFWVVICERRPPVPMPGVGILLLTLHVDHMEGHKKWGEVASRSVSRSFLTS